MESTPRSTIRSSWSKFCADLFRRKSIASIRGELNDPDGAGNLHRNLTLFDLVCFGIAAIVGAGIFSTIGNASADGGPAVTLLFVLTAITCLFSALCYAEFAARVPVSGSAYTYAYAAFGELVAWIIGWALLMEYAIGNSTVAFSWSEYLTTFLKGFHAELPAWLATDYYSCAQAAAEQARAEGTDPSLPTSTLELLRVWDTAPKVAGLRMIVDLPALTVNLLVTCLVYVGIRESKTASNLMVMLKIGVVLLVILVGAFYVQPSNWSPFAPNGADGVLKGIAAVFFAYIGFDAISTTAEECKDPQRDLPRATVITLVVCTVLYIVIALVLTGMVSYRDLGRSDPLAYVFERYNLRWMSGIVSLSAVVAITSVFLVFQIGQPRIWMAMARDGLMPARFAKVHPRYKTPAFSTVITGLLVAVPIVFLNQSVVTDLCSIGTLFAFMLVSAGVLALEEHDHHAYGRIFQVPYINARYFMPGLWLLYTIAMVRWLPDNHNAYTNWSIDKATYIMFYVALTAMSVLSAQHRWSLIPVLGVLTNLYLMAGLHVITWLGFLGWCAAGLAIYFGYSYRHSRLRKASSA